MTQAPLGTILVVDDEPDICRNLADILEDLGYCVETAHGGEEALAKVRSRSFDVALLDYRMPGMDGLTLYRKIREEQPEVVALIVTAYASPQVADESLEAGAWKVLAKPVDLTQLISMVGEAIDQPAVMVVDDDDELCQNLWDLFREQGYRVCLAHNEDDANRRLKERKYEVVLVDLKLPPRDGGEVLQAVRRRDPAARLVLITGHREELEQKMHSVAPPDADAVCFKPFNVSHLLETIHQLARRKN